MTQTIFDRLEIKIQLAKQRAERERNAGVKPGFSVNEHGQMSFDSGVAKPTEPPKGKEPDKVCSVITFEVLRAKLIQLNDAKGFRPAVKIILSFGVCTLIDLEEVNFQAAYDMVVAALDAVDKNVTQIAIKPEPVVKQPGALALLQSWVKTYDEQKAQVRQPAQVEWTHQIFQDYWNAPLRGARARRAGLNWTVEGFEELGEMLIDETKIKGINAI